MRLCVLRPAPGRVCTRPPARRREAGMSRCGCRISIYDNYKFFLLNGGRTESSITPEFQPTDRTVSRSCVGVAGPGQAAMLAGGPGMRTDQSRYTPAGINGSEVESCWATHSRLAGPQLHTAAPIREMNSVFNKT